MAYGANHQILDASEAAQKLAQTRDTNSIMAGWVDRGPWFYWDTLTAAAGAQLDSSYQLFSVGVGQQNPLTGVAKTALETNMVRGNQFPPPRCLLLMQIGFSFSPTVFKPDVDSIIDGCVIKFTIDEKVFHEGPIEAYPSGLGLMGVSTKTGESVYTIGLPSVDAGRRYGEWSKYIAPLQQFNCLLSFPGRPTMTAADDGGRGLRMRCYIDGLTDRSVQ